MKKPFLALASALTTLGVPAFAHCPLCTAATGGFLIVARAAGVSDLIIGTLAGGFAVSTALWFHNWLKKRNKGKTHLPMQAVILTLFSLLATVLTFAVVQ